MFKDLTIGDIVIKIPKSMNYFRMLGIDFCCGGNRILKDVIKEMGLNQEDVFSHLENLDKQKEDVLKNKDFTSMSQHELIEYIIERHHGYLKNNLPTISRFMEAVMRAHGANHPELFEIGKVFGILSTDLGQHIIKEETVVFKALENKDNTIQDLTDTIIHEHEDAGQLLLKLRELTNGYTVPSDACESYVQLYKLLEELEEDVHTHVHLENNILFKEYDQRPAL